jgi:hypothetical protein
VQNMNGQTRSIRKTLSANDLGITGSHQAGLHIPKDDKIISFFPVLDSGIENPDCMFELFSQELGQIFLVRFVYYNNRMFGTGTRDEFRLTRTSQLLRGLSARVGDALQIDKQIDGSFSTSIIRSTGVFPQGSRRLSGGWQIEIGDR